MVITGAPRKRLVCVSRHVGSNPTLSATKMSGVRLQSDPEPNRTGVRLKSDPEHQLTGEMTEWLKVHAWKACVRKRTVGSNPTLSASISIAGPEPCALGCRELRQARKGATVSE